MGDQHLEMMCACVLASSRTADLHIVVVVVVVVVTGRCVWGASLQSWLQI